jgi:hypothetical protein
MGKPAMAETGNMISHQSDKSSEIRAAVFFERFFHSKNTA